MLPHVMRQGTDDFPNKQIQDRVVEMEQNGEALIATLFSGFPHADIHNAGLSAVVVTDNDPEAARRLCYICDAMHFFRRVSPKFLHRLRARGHT